MTTAVQQRQFLTVLETALWLKVSPKTIYRAIERGDLNAVRAGAQIRLEVYQVEAWLREGSRRNGQAA
jgi:excisionase family DNA binding protein